MLCTSFLSSSSGSLIVLGFFCKFLKVVYNIPLSQVSFTILVTSVRTSHSFVQKQGGVLKDVLEGERAVGHSLPDTLFSFPCIASGTAFLLH